MRLIKDNRFEQLVASIGLGGIEIPINLPGGSLITLLQSDWEELKLADAAYYAGGVLLLQSDWEELKYHCPLHSRRRLCCFNRTGRN